MYRKIIQSFFVVLLSASALMAQELSKKYERRIEKADMLYDRFVFKEAIDNYKKALDIAKKEIDYPMLRIAEAYRLIDDNENALLWYNKVGNSDILTDLDKAHYSQVLIEAGEYERAAQVTTTIKSELREMERLQKATEGQKLSTDSMAFFIDDLVVNSKEADFSPTYYEDGIVFCSNREHNRLFQNKYYWDESLFLDLYYTQNADSTEDYFQRFHRRINTIYHEGPADFYDDDLKVIFTRNNFSKGRKRLSDDGVNKLKLYYSERESKDDKWEEGVELPFNNDEYSVGHPSLTSDGKTLYFSSDMPGSYGKADIYYAELIDGEWSAPINMGPEVNTAAEEHFPFIYNDSILFFASKGHIGLGGLDIYSYDIHKKGAKAYNLGKPLNTQYDDFGLIVKGNSGYFSSNRAGGKGKDDIYHFKAIRIGDVYVAGSVINVLDNSLITGADVVLADGDDEVLKDTNTGQESDFEFQVSYNNVYNLSAAKQGFVPVAGASVETSDLEVSRYDVVLKLEPRIHFVQFRAIDLETQELIEDATLTIDTETNALGQHVLKTRAGAFHEGMATHPNYFASEGQIDIGYARTNDTLSVDLPMERIVIDKPIALENIYYDLDKSDIRPDAAIELDKLVKVLEDNPKINIELSSHTDSRGSDSYNMALSQRRAESAVKYIISNGIDSNRITAKGYGETKLVNECSNGVQCTKEQHQANRRTEFKVTSVD